jgi:hypothetical protein
VDHFNNDPSSLGHAVHEHERPRAVKGRKATVEASAEGIDLLVPAWEVRETSLFKPQPERRLP